MASDAITTLKAFEEMRAAQTPRDLDRIEVIEQLRKSIEEFELGVKLGHTKWCYHLHRAIEHSDIISKAPCLCRGELGVEASLAHWVTDQCADAVAMAMATFQDRMEWRYPLSYPYNRMTEKQARTLLHKILDCVLQPYAKVTIIDRTWASIKSAQMYAAGCELDYVELSEALGGITGAQHHQIHKQTLHYSAKRCYEELHQGELLPGATTQQTLLAASNWAVLAVWINLKRVERLGTSYSANMALRCENQFKTIGWSDNYKVEQQTHNMLGAIEHMAGMAPSFLDGDVPFGMTWRTNPVTGQQDNGGMADLIFTQHESMRMIPKPAVASVVLMEDVAPVSHKRKIERLD